MQTIKAKIALVESSRPVEEFCCHSCGHIWRAVRGVRGYNRCRKCGATHRDDELTGPPTTAPLPPPHYERLDPMRLAGLPDELKTGKRFVGWREFKRNGNFTELPVDPHTGGPAKPTDPSTWATIEDALAHYKSHPEVSGVGRVFDSTDGLIGVDFKDCRDPDGGRVSGFALHWLEKLNSYTEISPSKRGFKVWVRAKHRLGGWSGRSSKEPAVELHRYRRYFAITGEKNPLYSANVEERQEVIDALYADVFGGSHAQTNNLAGQGRGSTEP